jgi:hypothetical protein
MSEFDDLKLSDEYLEIIGVLLNDTNIKKYFKDMKLYQNINSEPFNMVYNEFTNYLDRMVPITKRKIKLQKILKK